MASTIKLKNGTSGAPSSLAGGEVAMNRTTGIFYFGNGSNVQELHRFNHISASGHITASGNISASGIITTPILNGAIDQATGLEINGYLSASAGTGSFTTMLYSSGQISASGVISGEGLYIRDDAEIVDDLTLGGSIIFDGNTITGINDSGEFDDDDAHIMTSAGINDRFALINADTTGTATNATNAVHIAVADNESTNEENLIPFIEDASATGNVGLESDGDFAYNPSTGTVSATIFKGNIDAVNGDFDGTLEADAITLGGVTVLAAVDEDTMSSNSATLVPTQQSVKAYVDKKKIHIMNTSFNDDMGTDEIFIPMNQTGESPNITNINVPMVMPVAGKLLKVHFRANQHQNVSSNQITFRLYDVDTGENWNTDNSNVLGEKVITGLPKDDHTTADFTTGLTSGGATSGAETNAFQAGDIIGVTMEHSADQNASNTSNYLVTFVFELDFEGY